MDASSYSGVCLHAPSPQSCPALCHHMDCSAQAPLTMVFPRQEYWSGLPCSSPGIFLIQRSNPRLLYPLHCGQILYPLSHLGSQICVSVQFSSVQSPSCVWLFATPWITARQASLSITNSWSSPKPMSIESVNAIQPSHPLSSPFPPAPNPSQHQSLFQWVSSLHQVAKVLEFHLQHQSFQWTPRTDLL